MPKFVYRWSIIHSLGAWVLALLSDLTAESLLEGHDRLCFFIGEIVLLLVAILVFLVFYIVPGLL